MHYNFVADILHTNKLVADYLHAKCNVTQKTVFTSTYIIF